MSRQIHILTAHVSTRFLLPWLEQGYILLFLASSQQTKTKSSRMVLAVVMLNMWVLPVTQALIFSLFSLFSPYHDLALFLVCHTHGQGSRLRVSLVTQSRLMCHSSLFNIAGVHVGCTSFCLQSNMC